MTIDTATTLADFIAAHGITATTERTDHNPHMTEESKNVAPRLGMPAMDHWRVRLQRPGKRMSTYFSMGAGHHGKAPEAADVLDCLASDSAGVENAQGFDDWASEYGYDTDSRKAHKTYIICKRQAERLQKFLGDEAYNALLWDTERL